MALQMRYVSRKPLGFEKENRVVVSLCGSDVVNKISAIKTELLKNSSILGITQSDTKLGEGVGMIASMGVNNETDKMSLLKIDDNYLKQMGMQVVSGRDFSKKLITDIGHGVIVNEAMVKAKGWDEPLGQRVMNFQVVGVVKDFHFASLHNPVEPLGMIRLNDSNLEPINDVRQLILHISGENISKTLSFLQEKFAEFDPVHPFRYEFMDDSLDKLYLSDQRLIKLIGIFAGVCIFISCMGLFGLAAFTTEQRTKEIGVRKVLGATTWQIITMLSRNILLLVLGGSIIASAVAYYAMDEWLTSFAYHTGINPFVFLFSAVVAGAVAFITVALQSFKTALANPVEALRYE
jgi:putative ABC transport system permease protein